MKEGYRCTECHKFVEEGSKVYLIRNENDIYSPFCTLKCAESFKANLINKFENIIEKIKKQDIEEDVW